jgi:uncharacterized RDD family membrane protein YckC
VIASELLTKPLYPRGQKNFEVMLHSTHNRIDCLVRVVTPENVEFEYSLAGPFQRLPAFLLDLMIRAILLFVMFVAVTFTTSFFPFGDTLSSTVSILLVFVLSWFYGAYLEARHNGQTFGKMAFRLRVISVDGRPINGVQAAIRNLLRLADIYPTPLIGLISMTTSERFQRIGDLAAGTMVILHRNHQTPRDIKPDDARAFALADTIPPTFVASYSMAQTIGFYMESRKRLHAFRRIEIAKKLADPLIAKLGLDPTISSDLLLCALYIHLFMSENQRAAGRRQLADEAPAVPPNLPTDTSTIVSTTVTSYDLPPVVVKRGQQD